MNIILVLFTAYLFRGNNITWLTVAVFIMHHPFTLSTLLFKPMNTISVVGKTAIIQCSRDPHVFPVDWDFASAGSTGFSYIYASRRITESLSSRYKINTDNRTRYDIVIDSVDLSHAGTYICKPITEEVISASAQLTVLASDPVCNTNASVLNGRIAEREYIRMWCSVKYTGDWIPVIEWTRNNEQTVDANITYTNTSSTVTSSLIIELNSSDDGVAFTCKTSFNPTSTKISRTTRPGETLATNVPDYQYLWNFTANVSYAPRNLTILPNNSVYEVGDRLVCSANGNPPPTYEWMEIETNKTIPGSVLTIDDYLRSDKNHSFRCTASNTVARLKREIFDTVTFTITITGRPRFTTAQYIIIPVIVVGAICCLVLTLHLCKNRCTKKRGIGIGRPEPDILQAVQINPYDIAESFEDYATDRLRSVHPPAVEGGNLQQRLPLPVYTEVRRKQNNVEPCSVAKGATGHLSRHQGLPVYTEVVKNRNGSKNSDWPIQTVETTATQNRLPTRTHTGADGTQYMDVTSIRDLNGRAPIRHPPMFSQMETYASIDHTVDAPPMLPPKRQ